jgi:hypothetical protein
VIATVSLGLVFSAIGLAVLLIGAVVVVLVYGRSEFHRNVDVLQDQARSAQHDIADALQTELALRDAAIARLQETCDEQTREIKSLRSVVAQGTQVAALVLTVDALRRDVLAKLNEMAAK